MKRIKPATGKFAMIKLLQTMAKSGSHGKQGVKNILLASSSSTCRRHSSKQRPAHPASTAVTKAEPSTSAGWALNVSEKLKTNEEQKNANIKLANRTIPSGGSIHLDRICTSSASSCPPPSAGSAPLSSPLACEGLPAMPPASSVHGGAEPKPKTLGLTPATSSLGSRLGTPAGAARCAGKGRHRTSNTEALTSEKPIRPPTEAICTSTVKETKVDRNMAATKLTPSAFVGEAVLLSTAANALGK
mmetsp:Transcript_36301/g.104290  ORF Transcript_36301/g.104290 Transcript_36301/m.104290 type:complete len:245 (-) Transcript_36301:1002-1736(-)